METAIEKEECLPEKGKKKNQAKEYLKGWVPYRIKRYWVYAVATIVALVTPWITINGNHLFLLSFDYNVAFYDCLYDLTLTISP